MTNIEHDIGQETDNIYKRVARILFSSQKGKKLSENDKFLLDYCGPGGLMDDPDDKRFGINIRAEMDLLLKKSESLETVQSDSGQNNVEMFNRNIGRRIPLYSNEVLKKASGHAKKEKPFHLKPLPFWMSMPSEVEEISIPKKVGKEKDLERGLHMIGKNLDDRFGYLKDEDSKREILEKRRELRDKIDLPVARGKDPHINDPFYQYLIKRICTWDVFKIFREYIRATTGVSEELQQKICHVNRIVNEVLEGELTFTQRCKKLQELADEYGEKWGVEVLLAYYDQPFAL